MSAKIDGTAGTASAYGIEPTANESSTPPPASTTAVSEQTEPASDTSSAASRRLESALEANYMRDQLNQAQHRTSVGVLYDKPSHAPAANASETKAAGQVCCPYSFPASVPQPDVQVKKEIGTPQG